jgi:plastocyanin
MRTKDLWRRWRSFADPDLRRTGHRPFPLVERATGACRTRRHDLNEVFWKATDISSTGKGDRNMANYNISITANHTFAPQTQQVKSGDTVTWVDNDPDTNTSHTVSPDDPTAFQGSGDINAGDTYIRPDQLLRRASDHPLLLPVSWRTRRCWYVRTDRRGCLRRPKELTRERIGRGFLYLVAILAASLAVLAWRPFRPPGGHYSFQRAG